MKKTTKTLYLIIILLFCLVFDSRSVAIDNQENYTSVYVLKHTWHTGIIFKAGDIKETFPLLLKDFKESDFIEIGWGDKGFYMAEKETVWLALKAALWPTKSVLHVADFKSQQFILFNEEEILELRLAKENFDVLLSYIKQSFYLNQNKEFSNLGDGLYGKSYFYLSSEKYHLFKTCNVWLARGLKKANIPIKPFYAITSKNVMKQLKDVNSPINN